MTPFFVFVSMTANGHALVKGRFQERPDKNTALEFEMGNTPNTLRGTAKEDAPYSFSNELSQAGK